MPTLQEMLAAANAVVPKLSPDEVRAQLTAGNAVLVDVREPAELAASGKIAGALAIPRGLLEFRADPASPQHPPQLHPDATIIIYCAAGGRAALAGKTLRDLGYTNVSSGGGFQALADADLPVEPG